MQREYTNQEKIKRTQERRALIWRMEEEQNEQELTDPDPVEVVKEKIITYLKEQNGILSSLQELPLDNFTVHVYIKISDDRDIGTYYHLQLSGGKKSIEIVDKDIFAASIDNKSEAIHAEDTNGHKVEISVSGATLEEVKINAYDSKRLDMLSKFAKDDKGFWGIFYNYPEKQAALLFASLNPLEREKIVKDMVLLKQIGAKLDNAQYARGLEKLNLTLKQKLNLLWEGRTSFSGRGIEFQDLRGLLLSTGKEGKALHDRLAKVFPVSMPLRIDFLMDEGLLSRYINAQRKTSGKPDDLLYDDETDSKEITLTPDESTLVNSIVKDKKTLDKLTEDEKKKYLKAFKRNALKVTFEMLDLSEKAVIESSDRLLEGEADAIYTALNDNASSIQKMNKLDRDISATGVADPKDPRLGELYQQRVKLQHQKDEIEANLRDKLSKKIPILQDPKIDLQDLYNDYSDNADTTELKNYLAEHLGTVFENIRETRKIMRGEPDQVYKLEGVMERTKEVMNMPAKVFDQIADEKIAAVKWNDFMLSIGLGIISLGLTFASFGTLTPLALSIVATTSFIVSGVDFYYTYKNYSFEKTTGETSINPETALSFSDPSVIWVIASFAGAVADVVSVVKIIKPGKLINFSKTGKGEAEIASEIENAGKISKGFTAADIERMMKQALEFKKTIKKHLLVMFEGKTINLKELDEIADIYLAENFDKLKKLHNADEFIKKDLPVWYEAKVKSVKTNEPLEKLDPVNANDLSEKVKSLDADGGHSWADHGAHTTESQHINRLKTGETPGGSQRGIPETSSKFSSDEVHLQAYEDALTKLEVEKINTKGGLKKKVELKNKPLSDSGISYSLDANQNVIKTPTNGYTAIFKLDPTTNKYKLITLFPE